MKKKILSFALSFCLLVSGLLMLSACHKHDLTKVSALAPTCEEVCYNVQTLYTRNYQRYTA